MKKIVIAICVAVVAILVVRFFTLHQVDTVALESIPEGASEADVESILGKPSLVETNSSQWAKWHYCKHHGVYCEVILDFDNRGRYRGRFHDTLGTMEKSEQKH
jgi:outer membrane protein assembly factor BamE (lipoprotein component of BamABCDE complex)